jgi:hypothetical protein
LADNVPLPAAAGFAAADELSYSGDTTSKVQIIRLVHVTGSEGAKTLQEIHGNSTPAATVYGLSVRAPVVSHVHWVTTGDTNAVNIKASAGTLKSVHIDNAAAYPIRVKFHNTAGAPTAGTGVVLAIGCPSGQVRDFVLPGGGKAFTTGIARTVVKGIADADATAVLASDANVEVTYE